MSAEQYPLMGTSSNDHAEYYCPITCELMRDPVVCADGTSYECGAIEAWLSNHNTSPLTGMILPHKHIVPNLSLRALITEYRYRHGEDPLPSQEEESRIHSVGARWRGQGLGRTTMEAVAEHDVRIPSNTTIATGLPINQVAQMSPQYARQHLQRHVNSGWTTDSSAAASCTINSCITTSTVVTKQLSFVETRTEKIETTPYLAGAPSISGVMGVAQSVWDIECKPPVYFMDECVRTEIPFTSYIERCVACSGSGETECKTCKGTCRASCIECSPICRRSKSQHSICRKCFGSKKSRCLGCSYGKVQCSGCNGSGEVRTFKVLERKLTTYSQSKCTGTVISDRDLSSVTLGHAEGILLYSDQGVRVSHPEEITGELAANLCMVKQTLTTRVAKSLQEGGRVLQEKILLQQVPITVVKAEYLGHKFHWYVYGTGNIVSAFNYPNKCCEWCNRCIIS